MLKHLNQLTSLSKSTLCASNYCWCCFPFNWFMLINMKKIFIYITWFCAYFMQCIIITDRINEQNINRNLTKWYNNAITDYCTYYYTISWLDVNHSYTIAVNKSIRCNCDIRSVYTIIYLSCNFLFGQNCCRHRVHSDVRGITLSSSSHHIVTPVCWDDPRVAHSGQGSRLI